MNKINKVIVDASAPNCAAVKKALEDKGIKVVVHESKKFDFDDEIIKQINQLKAFESMYFKNPQSQKVAKPNILKDPDWQQPHKSKSKSKI